MMFEDTSKGETEHAATINSIIAFGSTVRVRSISTAARRLRVNYSAFYVSLGSAYSMRITQKPIKGHLRRNYSMQVVNPNHSKASKYNAHLPMSSLINYLFYLTMIKRK